MAKTEKKSTVQLDAHVKAYLEHKKKIEEEKNKASESELDQIVESPIEKYGGYNNEM